MIATGARPNADQGKRELFVEETSTVAVLERGAVVRLREAVAPGQLVVLTNKVNGREVVTQVAQKPEVEQCPGFAELHFTEGAPGFWDAAPSRPVQAPTPEAAKPTTSPSAEAAPSAAPEPTAPAAIVTHEPLPKSAGPAPELPASTPAPMAQQDAEPTSSAATATFDGIELEMIAPGAEDLERVQREIEAANQPLANSAPIPAADIDPGTTPAATQSSTDDLFSALLAVTASDRASRPRPALALQPAPAPHELLSSLLAVAGDDKPQSFPANEKAAVEPPAISPVVAAPPAIADTVPGLRVETVKPPAAKPESADSPRPTMQPPARAEAPASAAAVQDAQPSLSDGSAMEETLPKLEPERAEKPAKPAGKACAPRRPATQKQSDGEGKSRLLLPLAAVLIAALAGGAWYANLLPFAKRNVEPSSAPVIAPRAADLPAKPASAVAQPSAAAESADPSRSSSAVDASTSKSEDSPAETADRSAKPAPLEEEGHSEHGTSGGEKLLHAVKSVEPVPGGGPIEPAKLLHSVKPVYPAEAMRHYITGDIKLEGTVEPSGRVSKITVVSGPDALQSAAIDAFRKYKYQPATQDGHAVTTQVSAVVKFLFNP